jgi:hypothetical protein
MQVIENIDEKSFKLNGLKYVKNFMITKQGDNSIGIYNAYDTRLQILSSTAYSQISVNGIVYNSLFGLIDVLAPLLFYKQGGGTVVPQSNSDWNSVSGVTQIYNKPIISSKIVSLTTPSGVPSDGDEWILYTI